MLPVRKGERESPHCEGGGTLKAGSELLLWLESASALDPVVNELQVMRGDFGTIESRDTNSTGLSRFSGGGGGVGRTSEWPTLTQRPLGAIGQVRKGLKNSFPISTDYRVQLRRQIA